VESNFVGFSKHLDAAHLAGVATTRRVEVNSRNGISPTPHTSDMNGCAVAFGIFVVFAFGFVMGVGSAVLVSAISG
jgi:hypothetical protein